MTTSIKNIKNEIDSRLAGGGLDALACCQLQNAQTILTNEIVTTVANLASLPRADLNEGRFVYVDDINEYRFSSVGEWTDDPDSTLRIVQKQLWIWGGSSGGSGDGTTTCRCSPVREFYSATDWCQVSASGNQHAAAVKTTGQLWTWGSNSCGAIGDGTTVDKCSPVREFCSATDWCQVSAGTSQTVAVKTTGQLWTWGSNVCGKLGDGTTITKCSPVRERCSATDWCQVSATAGHNSAIKTSGQLWAWGSNACGVLGDGTTVEKCSPVREFCSATDWCQVSVGNTGTTTRNLSTAIKTSGQLWAWGYNRFGGLGDGTTTSRCSPVRERCSATDWCGVSAGGCMIAAIKTSGQIWTWGSNVSGRLGTGTVAASSSPVREFCSATDWCQVSAGSYHNTMAVKTSGELWAWGNNAGGKLGDGTTVDKCSPVREISSSTGWCQVSAGRFHSAAILNLTKGFLE